MASWYGVQTIENTPEIVERLRDLLTGKKYTFVSTNDGFNPESRIGVDVRTDQKLENGTNGTPFSIWYDEKNDPPRYCGFNVGDTYGVWGVHTSATETQYDPTFNVPYWVFDYNQARVVHRAPAGHLLVWVIAVQNKE